jgi:hypothetical protein
MLHMNDKPHSIWTKSWTGPRVTLVVLLILALIALSAAIMLAANAVYGEPIWQRVPLRKFSLFGLVGVTSLVTIVLLFALLIPSSLRQRLFNLQMAGRCLFFFACLSTLIALFYAAENWRGRRAWDHYVRQQAAKGEEMDLAALIPPTIPDDKNFALCPLLNPIFDYMHKTLPPSEVGGGKGLPNPRLGVDRAMLDKYDLRPVGYGTYPSPQPRLAILASQPIWRLGFMG